jgi:hypothetical protein
MKKEQLVMKCLEDIKSGSASLEKCSMKYPHIADELTTLLGVADRISTAGVYPTSEFKLRAAKALALEMATNATHSKTSHGLPVLRNIFSFKNLAFRFALGIVIFSLLSGGVIYGANDSLPGDILYPVKRGIEDVRLTLALAPESKAEIHLYLITERVEETIKVLSLEHHITGMVLQDIPANINKSILSISESTNARDKLLQRLIDVSNSEYDTLAIFSGSLPEDDSSLLTHTLEALNRGKLIGKICYYNRAFLTTNPSVYDNTLETRVFKIEGILINIDNTNWNVGGVRLHNVNESSGTPELGDGLRLEGIISTNTTYIWVIEHEPSANDLTIVEGIVSDKSSDNSTVYIGGLEFRDIDSLKSVELGTPLLIKGKAEGDFFHVDEVEDDEKDSTIDEENDSESLNEASHEDEGEISITTDNSSYEVPRENIAQTLPVEDTISSQADNDHEEEPEINHGENEKSPESDHDKEWETEKDD